MAAVRKMRTGLIGKKLGMTRIFDATGAHIAATAFLLDGNQVIAQRTADRDGYVAVQVGAGVRKASRTTAPQRGHFAKAKVEPKQVVTEFRVNEDGLIDVGAEIGVDHFVEGQFVDVTGITVGRGMQGPMKRWGFKGLRASHGVSASHRSHGSTGQRQDPGKVFKNKKMAGHMGVKQRTQQSLRVLAVDTDANVLFVKGSVPGFDGAWVTIKDSIKKKPFENLPFPAAVKQTGGRVDEQMSVAPEIAEDATPQLVNSSAETNEGEQA